MKKFLVVLLLLDPALGFAMEIEYDFETDPISGGLELVGSAAWLEPTSPGTAGFLSLNDPRPQQQGIVIATDPTQGELLQRFTLSAELRLGGGTSDPGAGLSFNLAAPNDPFFDDFDTFSNSPDGSDLNLAEEGTLTGLSIGLDESSNGAADTIGISVRVAGELIEQVSLPTLHGEADDATSLQTGAADSDLDQLGWAPLTIQFNEPDRLTVHWKNNLVFDRSIDYEPINAQLIVAARTGSKTSAHHVDNLRFVFNEQPLACDFNSDGQIDLIDIDMLREVISTSDGDLRFDVDVNGIVDVNDLKTLVEDETKINSYIGDSNLDGEFESSDLVAVFRAGEYDDDIVGNSTWSTGDWDANGDFDSTDIVFAFAAGGYNQGPRQSPAAVPEPISNSMAFCAVMVCLRARRQ